MNSTNYFHKNYAIQNLKKSKGVLALFLGIVPILNSLVLLLSGSYGNQAIGISNISIFNIIGLYFLPIVISICLFNYIFKKKSVDFIGSFPISRKSIFITNTIVGIGLILLMMIINVILISLIGLVTSKIIPISLLFDYFILWVISYIFAFTISNIAVSVSGNAITSIVVSFLLLIIVPFTYDYMFNNAIFRDDRVTLRIECKTDKCIPDTYSCYNDTECLDLKEENIYELNSILEDYSNNFTLPYNLPRSVLNFKSNSSIYNFTSIVKMFIFSVVSAIVGFVLFKNRKMENNETSFKSDLVHSLVKGLLVLPVLILFYNSIDSIISLCLFLTIFTGYYFLYDLITRRGIGKFFETIKYMIITLILSFGFVFIVEEVFGSNNHKIYSVSSDEVVEISFSDFELTRSDTAYLKVTDEEIIADILQASINQYSVDVPMTYIPVYIKINNGQNLKYTVYLPDSEYQNILEKISETDEYKTRQDIDFNSIYAYYDNALSPLSKVNSKTRRIIEEAFKKYSLSIYEDSEYVETLHFVSYKDGITTTYSLPSNITKELEGLLVEEINKRNARLKEEISNLGMWGHNITSNVTLPKDVDYLVNQNNYKIKSFIEKYALDEFSVKDNYLSIRIYGDKQKVFLTNRVDEFVEVLDEIRETLKNDSDYLEYLKEHDILDEEKLGVDIDASA